LPARWTHLKVLEGGDEDLLLGWVVDTLFGHSAQVEAGGLLAAISRGWMAGSKTSGTGRSVVVAAPSTKAGP